MTNLPKTSTNAKSGGALLRASVTAASEGAGPGDDAQILIDGADTPVTAHGLTDYTPTPGDRLLVQRVGSRLEVIQFTNRGTVPYVDSSEYQVLSDQVDSNTDTLGDTATTATNTANDLAAYKDSTDSTLSGLQAGFDVLTGLGQAGVEEDYMWVGDDPSASTVKTVQISTFVQAGLGATDGPSLGEALDLACTDDVGDAAYDNTDTPMAVFYDAFVAAGLSALPYNR